MTGPTLAALQRPHTMRETLHNVFDVIGHEIESHEGAFALDSPGRGLWASCPAPLSTDTQTAHNTALVRWASIRDHGQELTDAINSGRMYSCLSLARSMSEGAARSWWNLAEGEQADEVVRRYLNDRIYGLHEGSLLLRALLPNADNPPDVQALAKRAEQAVQKDMALNVKTIGLIRDAARNYGLHPFVANGSKCPHVVKARPSTMEILGMMVKNPAQAATFYRLTSSIEHNSLHGMSRLMDFGPREGGGVTVSQRAIDPDDLQGSIWVGVATVECAALSLFRVAAYPTDKLDSALVRLRQACNPPPDGKVIAAFDEYIAAR